MTDLAIEIVEGSNIGRKFSVPQDGIMLGASSKCGIALTDKKIEDFHVSGITYFSVVSLR